LSQRGHLDQIQLAFCGELPRPLDGNDPQYLAGGVIEEADLGDADLLVDPQLSECDGLLLLLDI